MPTLPQNKLLDSSLALALAPLGVVPFCTRHSVTGKLSKSK